VLLECWCVVVNWFVQVLWEIGCAGIVVTWLCSDIELVFSRQQFGLIQR